MECENNLNYSEIFKYWKTYFPESDSNELEEIIKKMNCFDYNTLQEEYKKYENFEDNFVAPFVDFEYCNVIKKNLKWFEKEQLFTNYILPIVNKQVKKIYYRISMNNILYNTEQFLDKIINDINFKVYKILYKSIIYEVNYLRNNGYLKGNTSEERMQYFKVEYASKKNKLIQFYKEYYIITELASHVAKSSFQYIAEVIERIEENKKQIEEQFSITVGRASIKEIELGNGDTHQGGKSVVLVSLKNGQKFLYKPHQLMIDQKFENLMDWMSKKNKDMLDFKLPKTISGQDYGFSQYISHRDCKEQKEIENFYERIGELLAVLYSLNSSDFHYENIIACGEYPVLIDLETVIHPLIVQPDDKERNSAFAKAEKQYSNSVATIGMLPTYMKGNMEIGGLGAVKEQNSTFKTDFVVEPLKDTIHIERKHFIIKPEQNNPKYKGAYIDSCKYINEIEYGFRKVYRWIEKNKDEYIQYIIEQFSGCTGRIIIRPTLYYSQLLNISLHQEFARKGYERQLILYRVAQERYRDFLDIVLAEHEDLMTGNIPYFTHHIGEDSIYDSRGKRLHNSKLVCFFDELKEKIHSFSEKDLFKQIDYIRASYITRRNKADKTFIKYQTYQNVLQPEKWLNTASSIGEYIAENAIEGVNGRGKKDSAWICVTLQGFEEDIWIPSVLGHEFYSGNAGIAFYFTYLWKITGKDYFLNSAKKAAEIPLTLLDDQYLDRNSIIGAFTGIGGTLYMLNSLAEVTQDDGLKNLVEEKLISCSRLIQFDDKNDVIAGSAGYLAVALKVASKSKRKGEIDRVIELLVAHLIQSAIRKDSFVYWDCSAEKHYSGFSHGNAGIHTFLYLAMKYLGEERAQVVIEKSLNYERGCFSKKDENWFRSDIEQKISHAWCHGAPGILLSKLLLYQGGFQDDRIEKEIAISMKQTRQRGFGNNLTYCHGDLGNLAILDLAAKVLKRDEIRNANAHIFQELYNNILSKKWNTKEMKSCNTYGLMVGLSGWGYAMLANYAQDMLPGFLWLE